MPYNNNQPALVRLKTVSSEQRRPLAFWVGAGLSRDAGMPTWVELRDQLAAEALETLVTMEPNEAARREAELTQALSAANLWDSFATIKRLLGDPSYRDAIRSRFESAPGIDIPSVYKAIWEIKSVNGVLNLNIDGLATRSHRRVRAQEDIVSFVGRDAPDYAHLVAQRKPFIANLHGIHEAASTWVFTRSEIEKLLSNPAYISFISFVFGTMSVVFLGISADDVSAGGILQGLTGSGLDIGSHFWITNRRDAQTDAWASKAGVELIRYEPTKGGDHTSVLLQMLQEIREHKSFDAKPPVIVAPGDSQYTLPSVQDLKVLDEDDLRRQLTGYAKSLIERHGNSTSSPEYGRFLEEYSPNIHQAWHVTCNPPYNNFFDYRVLERVSSGPFSSVWKVEAADRARYALKIIQMDNLRDGPQLESFRRGVQSLGFLTKAGVAGTAKLKEAHEIPTAVIMDFIEGDNLDSIVMHPSYRFWSRGIRIMRNLCEKIDKAHNIEEGVLHRDIRPSNVMVPYFFWGESAADSGLDPDEVTVLNYDMSWHKDAHGKTISGNVQEAGFYAPEQLENREGDLARSAKVDSYGLGMTLYFSATKTSPPVGGSNAKDWLSYLKKIRLDPGLAWSSACQRLRRLVEAATDINPERRPSAADMGSQLTVMLDALEGRLETLGPDMWAEELFGQVIGEDYVSASEGHIFSRELRSGRYIALRGDLGSNAVELSFRNQATDGTDWSNIDKLWSAKLESARSMLVSQGWEILDGTRYSAREIHLAAGMPIKKLRINFPAIKIGLSRALDLVRLD